MSRTSHPVASTHLILRNAVNFWLVVGGGRTDSVYSKLWKIRHTKRQPRWTIFLHRLRSYASSRWSV